MRAKEFVNENASSGATSSGSVAAVAQPMGSVITRTQNTKPAKYANSVTNTRKRTK